MTHQELFKSASLQMMEKDAFLAGFKAGLPIAGKFLQGAGQRLGGAIQRGAGHVANKLGQKDIGKQWLDAGRRNQAMGRARQTPYRQFAADSIKTYGNPAVPSQFAPRTATPGGGLFKNMFSDQAGYRVAANLGQPLLYAGGASIPTYMVADQVMGAPHKAKLKQVGDMLPQAAQDISAYTMAQMGAHMSNMPVGQRLMYALNPSLAGNVVGQLNPRAAEMQEMMARGVDPVAQYRRFLGQ